MQHNVRLNQEQEIMMHYEVTSNTSENHAIQGRGKHQMYDAAAGVRGHTILQESLVS